MRDKGRDKNDEVGEIKKKKKRGQKKHGTWLHRSNRTDRQSEEPGDGANGVCTVLRTGK